MKVVIVDVVQSFQMRLYLSCVRSLSMPKKNHRIKMISSGRIAIGENKKRSIVEERDFIYLSFFFLFFFRFSFFFFQLEMGPDIRESNQRK